MGLLVWMSGVWLIATRFRLEGRSPPRSGPDRPPPAPFWTGRGLTARLILGPWWTDRQTLYARAGATPFFEALVGRFYDGVEADPSFGRSTRPTSRRRATG